METIARNLREIQKEISRGEARLQELSDKIEELSRKEQRLKAYLSREVGALVTISKTTWLNLLFGPQNINDFLRREDYLYAIIQNERNRILEIKATREELQRLRLAKEKELEALRKRKQLYEEQLRELALLKREKETLLREVRRNKALYQETLAILITAKKEIEKLAQEISATRAKLEKIKKEKARPTQKPKPILRPLFEVKGFLYPPVEGRVLRFFGLDRDLFTGKISFSPGIYLGAPPGTPVVAPFSAQVSKIRWVRSQGQVVVLDHGYGFISLIGGLGEIRVAPGQMVHTGEVLGTVGASPYGPSGVYYELRYGQKPQNPLEWLNLKKLKILR